MQPRLFVPSTSFIVPEVGEIYESIARAAPDRTIFCETGFNVGSSAAIFLHGTYGSRSEVHSFDLQFPRGTVDFLNEIYSQRGKSRLFAHEGDMSQTFPKFLKSGKRCDIFLADTARMTAELDLFQKSARNSDSLLMYHWAARNKEHKAYFFRHYMTKL